MISHPSFDAMSLTSACATTQQQRCCDKVKRVSLGDFNVRARARAHMGIDVNLGGPINASRTAAERASPCLPYKSCPPFRSACGALFQTYGFRVVKFRYLRDITRRAKGRRAALPSERSPLRIARARARSGRHRALVTVSRYAANEIYRGIAL